MTIPAAGKSDSTVIDDLLRQAEEGLLHVPAAQLPDSIANILLDKEHEADEHKAEQNSAVEWLNNQRLMRASDEESQEEKDEKENSHQLEVQRLISRRFEEDEKYYAEARKRSDSYLNLGAFLHQQVQDDIDQLNDQKKDLEKKIEAARTQVLDDGTTAYLRDDKNWYDKKTGEVLSEAQAKEAQKKYSTVVAPLQEKHAEVVGNIGSRKEFDSAVSEAERRTQEAQNDRDAYEKREKEISEKKYNGKTPEEAQKELDDLRKKAEQTEKETAEYWKDVIKKAPPEYHAAILQHIHDSHADKILDPQVLASLGSNAAPVEKSNNDDMNDFALPAASADTAAQVSVASQNKPIEVKGMDDFGLPEDSTVVTANTPDTPEQSAANGQGIKQDVDLSASFVTAKNNLTPYINSQPSNTVGNNGVIQLASIFQSIVLNEQKPQFTQDIEKPSAQPAVTFSG